MTMDRRCHALLALAVATMLGCASAPSLESPGPVPNCEGISVLVVFNSTSQMVEVMEYRRGNEDVQHRVARVGPGTHEVTVRSEGDYLYRLVRVPLSGADAQRQVTSGGTLRYNRECRPAGTQA